MISIKIAFRFLIRNPFYTLTIVLVIALGIGVQLFILTLSGSLNTMLNNQVTLYQEHLIINNTVNEYSLDSDFKQTFLDEGFAINYFVYTNISQVILKTNTKTIPFYLYVFDSTDGFSLFGLDIDKHIVSGRMQNPNLTAYENEIVISDFFAKQNNLKLGDSILLIDNNKSIAFTITGTYDLGIYRTTNAIGYVTKDQFLTTDDELDSILVQLKNPKDSTVIKDVLINDYGFKKENISTWQEKLPEIDELTLAQGAVTIVIQIFICAAIFIVVSNILGFTVYQKSKQIGILKAIGNNPSQTSRIFFFQSFILGVFGAIIGTPLGIFALNKYENYMVYSNGEKRIEIIHEWHYYVLSVLLLALTVFLAAVISINRAKKISIIELIKQ